MRRKAAVEKLESCCTVVQDSNGWTAFMLKPDLSSIALLDNSVYFSFKSLANNGLTDPLSLYNAAVFLEALILNDTLFLSPTNAWTPDSSDTLFQTAGPCRQLSIDSYSEDDIYAIFSAVLEDIRVDLTTPRIAKTLLLTPDVLAEMSELVNTWRSKLESDPYDLLVTYSGAVYNVDTPTQDFLKGLHTSVKPTDPPARHTAQYLLRANAAMHFAREAFAAPIPYVPHSHRTHFVIRKAKLTQLSALKLGRALIDQVNRDQRELSKRVLSRFFPKPARSVFARN